jgi:hypothetical protein
MEPARRSRRRLVFGPAVLVALLVGGLVALGVVGLGPVRPVFHRPISASANGGVVRVEFRAVPEGPTSPPFERVPTAQNSVPIALIQRFIPDPLPAPLNQWPCHVGGDLVVTLGKGTQIIYGPCHRPASIDRLWAEMIYVMSNGRCAPNCGPGGAKGP